MKCFAGLAMAVLFSLCGGVHAAVPPSIGSASPVQLQRIDIPGGLMLFHPNETHTVQYRLRNSSGLAKRVSIRFQLTDWNGREIYRRSGTASIPANGEGTAPFQLDTRGLRNGVYRLLFDLALIGVEGPAFERESYIAVTSRTKLRKATAGEFLYGLDVQLGDPPPESLLYRWMDAMGVDIVRTGYRWEVDPAYVRQQQAVFATHKLRALSLFDPPKSQNPAERKSQLESKCRDLEAIAREHPGMAYWELGNEPDLDFFYPGPIENYAADFAEMSRAIHRGNPLAVVMNGGLCFVGDNGRRRARRFVEVVDPGALNAFAYHGHGPGAAAERAARENMRGTAEEFGKGGKPFVETESGVAARTRPQEMMQARTAVQKLVYAQSVRMPLFIWFRLKMFEEDYGNLRTQDESEPRPAILAYRATVEALRGYRFRRTLATGSSDVETYLFDQAGGSGRACVLWTNRPVTRTVCLALASRPDHVRGARQVDMFGNASPVPFRTGGTIQVDATEAPVFLKWEAPDSTDAVRLSDTPVHAPDTAQIVQGTDNTFSVTVRNASPRKSAFAIRLAPEPGVRVSVVPSVRRVALPPRSTRTVVFTLRAGAAIPGLFWPEVWSVYRNADVSQAVLSRLTTIPSSLPGPHGGVPARRVLPARGAIVFAQPGERLSERTPAIILAEVVSDTGRNVPMGASADWWMDWYVNGKPVFNTLAAGNGGISAPTDHIFTLPLRKGRNIVAGRILSGSQGWKVLIADPAAVVRSQAQRDADNLLLTARVDGRLASRQYVDVQEVAPISPLGAMHWTANLTEWDATEPTAVLNGDSVINEFAKQPDQSLWWRGEDDLSAAIWVRYDARRLYLLVQVRDDTNVTATDTAEMWRYDSLQLGIARTGHPGYSEYTVGQVQGKTVLYRQTTGSGTRAGLLPSTGSDIEASVERTPGVTVYRLSLDRRTLVGDECFVNVLVNDNDGKGRKQFIEWTPGLGETKDPLAWRHIVLGHTGAKRYPPAVIPGRR